MKGYDRTWFTPAMLLSLLTIGISFALLVALIGISPLGSQLIGAEGLTGCTMNTTIWNTHAALGNTLWFGFAVIIITALCLLLYVTFKWMNVENTATIS